MDYDVILLDRFPPDKGGVALSRDLCKLGIATPILMLTARIGWGRCWHRRRRPVNLPSSSMLCVDSRLCPKLLGRVSADENS